LHRQRRFSYEVPSLRGRPHDLDPANLLLKYNFSVTGAPLN
jgi:hypothetical protein